MLDHSILAVSNVERSLAFYERGLEATEYQIPLLPQIQRVL
jgi:catechol 2,3-dioxygenase-like lactoylglutathione lyase family enzyme